MSLYAIARSAARHTVHRSSLRATIAAMSTSVPRAKTASALIIGDEILSGKTKDTNSNFLAKSLFDIGVDMRRIEVVPDVEEEIIEAVRRMSETYDYVFTTGGIGPTHDDITYESIAKAFNDELVLHEETLAMMARISPKMVEVTPLAAVADPAALDRKSYMTVRDDPTIAGGAPSVVTTTQPRLRMARLPSQSRSVFTPGLWVPLCITNGNVHIFPGIPRLFQAMLTGYLPTIAKEAGVPLRRRAVGTQLPESNIADALTAIQEQYGPQGIKIGSYPTFGDGNAGRDRVNVTVVGRDLPLVEKVASEIAAAIQGHLLPVVTPSPL
ncbi:hypothetical protein H9P43_004621 [Blastocladiella emersonii ATCC 22665]|nr:hypothetical protein H9P43_004621 [Blastocladiella emersonii ATCC 22665]